MSSLARRGEGQAPPRLLSWTVLLILGQSLLVICWIGVAPPHAAPAETAHLQRAQGLARGVVLGDRPPPSTRPTPSATVDPGVIASREWAWQTTRVLRLPAGITPRQDCATDAMVPASCVDAPDPRPAPDALVEVATNTGTTNPLSVLGPAALVRLGEEPGTALSWARVGQAVGTLLLLLVSVVGLRPAGGAAVAGLALAVTPFAAYLGAVVSPSGLEVWLALACLATTWRMLRSDASVRWVVAASACAVVLPMIRQPGLAWAGLALLGAVLVTPGPLPGRRLGWWAGSLGLGVLLAAGWQAVTDVPTPLRWPPRMADVARLGQDLRILADPVIGGVNGFEVPPPDLVVTLWLGASGVRVVHAAWQRGRAGLAAPVVLLGMVGFTLAFWTLSYAATGFGLQGRHLLGGLVLVPVTGGLARRPPPWAVAGTALLAAVGHFVILAGAARRFAVGAAGPWRFWQAAAWDPAGGWWPWIVLAVLGACCLAAAGLAAAPGPPPPPTNDP